MALRTCAAYTYVLAPTPRDYEVLSEAGTMSGSGCPGAVWWSVSYDRVSGSTMLSEVDVIVTSAAAGVAVNPMLAAGSYGPTDRLRDARQSDSVGVMVGGHRGLFSDLGDGVGRLVSIANGRTFAVMARSAAVDPTPSRNLATRLTLISPTNPAIQACLANCAGRAEEPLK